MTGRKCPRLPSWPGLKELEMEATRVAESGLSGFLFQKSAGQRFNVLLINY
jgi:hypothetical protein